MGCQNGGILHLVNVLVLINMLLFMHSKVLGHEGVGPLYRLMIVQTHGVLTVWRYFFLFVHLIISDTIVSVASLNSFTTLKGTVMAFLTY